MQSLPQRKVSNDFRAAHMWNAVAPSAAAVSGGITGDACHADLKRRPHAGKSRGAGERWRKSFQRLPADDKLRKPHPVPRSTQLLLVVRELQASVSPTPFVADPGAASAIVSQSCTLQISIRHHRVDVKSSTGSERTAPRLLLLLRGDLALGRRLLFRGGLRLCCLLHHTALLAKA